MDKRANGPTSRPYAAELSVAENVLERDPGFAAGWMDAQIQHIAPSFGATIVASSVTERHPDHPGRILYRVYGYYLDEDGGYFPG